MNSFNDIQKIKYKSDIDQYVSLREYISFSDDKHHTKCLVLKFQNVLTQYLFGFRGQISSYTEDDQLIEEVIFDFPNVKIEPGNEFVPEHKLNVNYKTKYIKFRLVEAYFERIHVLEGNVTNNPLTYKEYIASKVGQLEVPVREKKYHKKDLRKPVAEVYEPEFTGSYNYASKAAIYHKKGLFVLMGILSLGVLGYSTYATISQKYTQNSVTIDNVTYTFAGSNKSEKKLYVKDYTGKKGDITIKSKVGDYTILGVESEAFKNNTRLTNVTFEVDDDFQVGANAFEGCTSLKSVSSENTLILSPKAFFKCTNLETFNMPNTDLNTNIFYANEKMTSLSYYSGGSGVEHLYEAFGSSEDKTYIPTSLSSITTGTDYVKSSFFLGVDESIITYSNPDVIIEEDNSVK